MSVLRIARNRKQPANLVDLLPLLEDAESARYAVGAFNFCNAESAQAIVEEAARLRSPVILLTGPWEIPLLGARALVQLVESVATDIQVPLCLHLDHATDIDLVRECIEAGFPSVMIDASRYDFEDNVDLTRRVVEMAHPVGITVEGELGAVGRVDDSVAEGECDPSLTDPDLAAEFVRRTGVDALAVSIGNAHGIYTHRPQLDFDRLKAIRDATRVPLVLHGGSGTSSDQLKKAIEIGISKVNVASEISQAYLTAIQTCIANNDGKFWYAQALVKVKLAIKDVVGRWIHQLGSAGRIP